MDTRLTPPSVGSKFGSGDTLTTLGDTSHSTAMTWIGLVAGISPIQLEQHFQSSIATHQGSLVTWLNGLLSKRLSLLGLGAAKRERLRSALKIANYLAFEELSERQTLGSPQECEYFLRQHLLGRTREVFCALFLNCRNHLMACEDLFMGTVDSAVVYPRDVVAKALEVGASSVIVAHNHPSGCAQPSRADRQITQRLRAALATVDINLLDHIIIGRGRAHSMAAHGDW